MGDEYKTLLGFSFLREGGEYEQECGRFDKRVDIDQGLEQVLESSLVSEGKEGYSRKGKATAKA